MLPRHSKTAAPGGNRRPFKSPSSERFRLRFGLLAARFAHAVEHEGVVRQVIAERVRDQPLRTLDPRIHELFDASAAHADDVVVMPPFLEFVRRTALFEVVTHEDPRALKLREHAVDRREPDVAVLLQKHLVDFFGGEMTALLLGVGREPLEDVENLQARRGDLETHGLQIVAGLMGGVFAHGCPVLGFFDRIPFIIRCRRAS